MKTIFALIREFLAEDRQGFKSRTSNINYNRVYASSFIDQESEPDYWINDPFFDTSPSWLKKGAKDVKRAWNAEADHEFMKSLVKVHWVKPADIGRFLSMSRKNEVSAMAYLPGKKIFTRMSGWGPIGIVIQGRTTLAANDMDAVVSGYHKHVKPLNFAKYASSGLPKRPNIFLSDPAGGFDETADYYILGKETFDENMHGSNELIVDNWSPTGIIIEDWNRGDTSLYRHDPLRIIEFIEKTGLPVFNSTMQTMAQNEWKQLVHKWTGNT